MSVRRILQSKGSADVLTIARDAKVSDAAKILSEKRVGALIVSEDGTTVQGILSERDIVRELGSRGTECMADKVADLMTRNVITASPDDVAVDLLSKMTKGRFRHLPVVEEGRMIGVISIGDVVKFRIEEMERENVALTDMIVGHG